MAVDLGLFEGKATKNKKKRGKEDEGGGGLVQITRLMIQRKRQPRAKSGLPFTELGDFVAPPHLLPVNRTWAVSQAWYTHTYS